MSAIATVDVIRKLRDLPSLPVVVAEVLRTFEQTDVNVGVLADKVAQDQALSAKTLRLANSSFYGLQRKVATIQQAITILGFDSVRTLIASAAITDAFSDIKCGTWDNRSFWRHSVASALCAKMLARHLGINQEIAFVSGLLHDIGKLVLVSAAPEQYCDAMKYARDHDCYALDAERHVLETDHTVVGRALAEHWRFPLPMQQAIALHHRPDDRGVDQLVAVVHVGDALAHGLDLSGSDDDLVPPVSDTAWRSLKLGPEDFRQVCRDTEAAYDEVCQVLVR